MQPKFEKSTWFLEVLCERSSGSTLFKVFQLNTTMYDWTAEAIWGPSTKERSNKDSDDKHGFAKRVNDKDIMHLRNLARNKPKDLDIDGTCQNQRSLPHSTHELHPGVSQQFGKICQTKQHHRTSRYKICLREMKHIDDNAFHSKKPGLIYFNYFRTFFKNAWSILFEARVWMLKVVSGGSYSTMVIEHCRRNAQWPFRAQD